MINKVIYLIILITLFLAQDKNIRNNYLEIIYIYQIIFIVVTGIYIFINYSSISKNELKLIIGTLICLLIFPNYYLFLYILIISKGIEQQKRVFYFLLISVFFYLLVILFDKIGLYSELEFSRRLFLRGGKILREDLGFGNPNTAAGALFPILMSIYYLWYEKNRKIVLGIILILTKIIYTITLSRTLVYVVFILIFISFIKNKYLYKLRYYVYLMVFFILYFSFILPSKLKGTIYDSILSWRFTYFDYFLTNYKISLLGSIGRNESIELALDNVYIMILLKNGIIGIIILVVLIIYIFRLLYKYNDYKAIRIFLVTLIYGMIEAIVFDYKYTILHLILYEYLINLNIKIKNNVERRSYKKFKHIEK